jgi:hypothetical protein
LRTFRSDALLSWAVLLHPDHVVTVENKVRIAFKQGLEPFQIAFLDC